MLQKKAHSKDSLKIRTWEHFSKNDHLQFGYHQNGLFFAHFGKPETHHGSFREECFKAAAEILSILPHPPTILLSGGLDSEIISECFRLQGLPFKVKICQFENNLNHHDIEWAVKYCTKHQIVYEIFNFPIREFYESQDCERMAQQLKCPYPMILAQIKMNQNLIECGEFPLTGTGNPQFKKIKGQNFFYVTEFIFAHFRFLQQIEKIFPLSLYLWKPEITSAFINSPTTQIYLKDDSIENSELIKFDIYSQEFDLQNRPKYKGYEKFETFHKKRTNDLIKLVGGRFDQYQLWSPNEISTVNQKFSE